MVISHVRSWKMRKKFQNFLLATMKKPGTYIELHALTYLYTKFGDFSLKNEFRNVKRGRLIKWSIMRIFGKCEKKSPKIFVGDYEKTRDLY